jgi:hypothetical protein
MIPAGVNAQKYITMFEQELVHTRAKDLYRIVATYFQYFEPANAQEALTFLTSFVGYFDNDAQFERIADMIPIHFNRILNFARQGNPDALPHLNLRNERR